MPKAIKTTTIKTTTGIATCMIIRKYKNYGFVVIIISTLLSFSLGCLFYLSLLGAVVQFHRGVNSAEQQLNLDRVCGNSVDGTTLPFEPNEPQLQNRIIPLRLP